MGSFWPWRGLGEVVHPARLRREDLGPDLRLEEEPGREWAVWSGLEDKCGQPLLLMAGAMWISFLG